jgi:hypothetical protein
MCVAKTAQRKRRQAKLDPRYRNWRKSAMARDKRLTALKEKERLIVAHKGAKHK